MEEISQQTEKLLEQEKKPIQEDTFFDKYIAGEKTKGMFNPTAKDVLDVGTDFIPGVSETKDIISLGTNVSKGEYASAGIDLASLVLGAVPIVGDVARRGLKTLTKNVGKSEDVVSKQADEVGESLQKVYGNIKPPTKTTKAYKLFKTDKKGNLYPLFVKMKDNKPLELDKWTKAEAGEINPKTGKVKSSLGDLAYRPGFHGGDLPIATHIGGKKGKVTKPNYRKDNQVWAEVEFGNDVDWQSVANSRAVKNKDGSVQVKTAHITDQVPEGGNYRYKTNPNMTGNWIIGGELKINKVLSDKEVKSINDKAGVADLPRLKDLNLKESKKLSKGGDIVDKDIEKAEKPKMRPSNQMEMFTYLKDNPDVKGMKEIEMDRMRGIITDDDPRAPINTEGLSQEAIRQRVLEREQLLRDIDKYRESKTKAAKGGSMSKQMELFNEGGLKDEGGTVDPVSGNDVPPGSTQEEVRDDIPAQLSEGEFVFPADVVRYIGLEKLMMLRQEAKQGLKQMEAMGQMGNSDEATMPDDLPFDMTDLDIEDDLEYNTGGVVQAQQGTYLAPTIPTQYRNESIETTNPMGMQQIQAGLNRGVNAPASYVPNMGRMYTPQAQAYAPVSYTDFLGTSAAGAPQTETVRYFNEATGQTRMIPHVVNPDGSRGPTLYPVPQGFVIQEEAPKEEAKKTKVESAKVKPVDAGDDSSDQEQRERDEAMYGRGAGRISLGGDIKPGTTVKTGFLGKGTSSLTTGSTTFGIGYDLPGGVLPGIATIKAITAGTGNLPDGATGKFTKNGLTLTKSAEVTNAIIKNPRGPEAEKLIKQHEEYIKSYSGLKNSNPDLTDKQVRDIVNAMVQTNVVRQTVNNEIERNFSVEDIDSKSLDNFLDAVNEASTGKDGGFDSSKFNSLPSGIQETYQETVTQKEDDQQQYGTVGDTSIGVGTDTYDSSDDSSYDGGYDSSQDTSSEGSYEDDDMYNKGGLAGKKKPKPKKMKRGGLASR